MKDGYEECERCSTRRPPAALTDRRCTDSDFCERTRAERNAIPLQQKKKKRLLIVDTEEPNGKPAELDDGQDASPGRSSMV